MTNWMESMSIFLTLSACYVLCCRIDKMLRGVTRPGVFLQHALLAIGLFGAFLLHFTQWSELSMGAMALGVLAFLFASANRWRHGAPEDTTKPMDLDMRSLHNVSGGFKHKER